jgi:cytochrome c553
MQVIPKATPLIEGPRIGYAAEALARLSLGTVPVESDGSVYCEAPVGKEIYFQLLDSKGMVVHSMRSGTYAHAGEQMTCAGCHEDKWKATPPSSGPLAMRRAPSRLVPEPGAEKGGVTPINYSRLVKPVFDARCVTCHQQQGKGPVDMNYAALKGHAFYFCGNGNPYLNGDITTAVRGGSRTIPGKVGAAYSTMGKALLNATHQAAGITADEFRRVTLWLDGNSNRYSAYRNTADQDAGKLVWPEIDFDSTNTTGVESDFPLPGGTAAGKLRNAAVAKSPVTLVVSKGSTVHVSHGGPAVIRILNAAGRTVSYQATTGKNTVIEAPRSGCYLVVVQRPDGSCAQRERLVIR